ncbi:AMP-dependent synthetase and ligase [Arcobacter nitrofigilis DSM 7299]|uniref:AMP-dependent synthetase and ligase n=1 Tax=Arcobacter nitrofigilis (strain ATCC 33309 / DSM 7299 / CCUG 15893 / LMG 7604 / NCTC 12251 / CI) TaxID=572480 RepID=D5V572_ARCNC|nr:long-chain fatty acid--CoA ligase [Arcobacter nitrofigilis]ADG93007.1 AMP-dependent synthetase and ligase [Arcobacter nitrofigilis DSM 7299]
MNPYRFSTYNEMFDYLTTTYDNPTLLNFINANNKYESISALQFKEKVICLCAALQNLGIKKGTMVAIFSKSSPFWLIFDFALQQLGAVSVPIFANISTKNLNFELKDSKCKYIFIDDINRINDIKEEIIFITHNFCIKEKNYYNLDEIIVMGKEICNRLEYVEHKPKEDDIFSIVYTSGNTGDPKGVILSHKNIISQVKDINELIQLDKKEVILSILPLAHIFERAVMSYYISRGVSIYFIDDITNVATLMKTVRPTMMTVVPRLLEKIYYKIKTNISDKPFFSKLIASFAFHYALKENINKDSILFKLFNKLVYSKFREIFGGRIKWLVSGGAPLEKNIYQFFLNIEVPLYQGYGMTEFSPVISTNYPGANRVGTSGKAMPTAEVKIENDELLVKGPSLMKGYLNNEELTKKTIDEKGWLHTGDVASIDEDGYIYIQSRKKDIFKTSTGEYVNAIPIEQELSKNKYIEFAVLISSNRKYTTALLFVDHERYTQHEKSSNLTIDEYFNQSRIQKSIQNHIDRLNKKVNKWEMIIKYKLITKQATIEGGELTPSMKVCREAIENKYKEEIQSMY